MIDVPRLIGQLRWTLRSMDVCLINTMDEPGDLTGYKSSRYLTTNWSFAACSVYWFGSVELFCVII
jgi:hypothetical protein